MERTNDSEPTELMDKDKAYEIVSAYANEQEGELAEAMLSVLWRSQMDYEYIEGLLIHCCKCGCIANGIWEEGTYLHKHVLHNNIEWNQEYTDNGCKFCNLE